MFAFAFIVTGSCSLSWQRSLDGQVIGHGMVIEMIRVHGAYMWQHVYPIMAVIFNYYTCTFYSVRVAAVFLEKFCFFRDVMPNDHDGCLHCYDHGHDHHHDHGHGYFIDHDQDHSHDRQIVMIVLILSGTRNRTMLI